MHNCCPQGYLRGHGSYIREGEGGETLLVAAVAGNVERVNKLVSVRPTKSKSVLRPVCCPAVLTSSLLVDTSAKLEILSWPVSLPLSRSAGKQMLTVPG